MVRNTHIQYAKAQNAHLVLQGESQYIKICTDMLDPIYEFLMQHTQNMCLGVRTLRCNMSIITSHGFLHVFIFEDSTSY